MTVNTVEIRKTYNGNGVTDAFATPYFLVDADLVVYVDGVLQTITTDYTVAGAGVPAGGTVTFVTPPPTGTANVIIIRDPALTQLTDWVENDANGAEVKETAFDKLTMIAQRQQDKLERTLRLQDFDLDADLELPLKADRASQFLGFDANGDLIAAGGTIDALLVSAFIATLIDDADAAAARATLGVEASGEVMSTGTATATYYAKLATLAFPATNDVAANLHFILTPKSASGSYPPVIVSATVLQGTGGLSTSSKINVISSDETAIAHDDLFLVTSAATNGTNIELHMQSIIAAAYDVQLLSSSFDTGVSISAWNDGATWSATDPTIAAAVFVTSDWDGYNTYLPVSGGLTSAGTGTYTAQAGEYVLSGGLCVGKADLAWTAHTGTGDLYVTLPVAPRAGIRTSVLIGRVSGLTRPSSDFLSVYAETGSTGARLVVTNSSGVQTSVAMDTSVTLISYSFAYPV